MDITGLSIGKRYVRADEVGIPFAIAIDFDQGVTIRERDSKQQVRVSDDAVVNVVRDLSNGSVSWEEISIMCKVVVAKKVVQDLADDIAVSLQEVMARFKSATIAQDEDAQAWLL